MNYQERFYALTAQPYGGGSKHYIGTVGHEVASGSLRELYSVHADTAPTLDNLSVGHTLHCGVPRCGKHAGGLLTIERTR